MAINPHIVLYNGAGAGYRVEQAFQNNLWGCTSLYISALPRDLWTSTNERLALPGLIAQYGKRVWFGGIDGNWGATKIADLIDYWENKSGVGHLIDGYGVRDEYPLSDQIAIGNAIELLHSLTSKPIWANIIPPMTADAAAQRMNFGTNINRYPNVFTFSDYPFSGDDSRVDSTYLGSIYLCRSWARLMINAYLAAPVYLSPANGHVLGIISQAFQQVALTRSDKDTVNAGYFAMSQAKFTQQMDLAFAQGSWNDLSDQRDGKQIFGNSFTSWYVHYDTGQDKGTRINLSGGSNTTVRDNLRTWVSASNTAARTTYAVSGTGVFQPGGTSGTTGQTATPIISPQTGTYTTGQNVTITCATSGATIYYTTNGSDPTAASAVYSAPVSVSSTTTVKALATKSGLTNSNIAVSVLTIAAAQPGNLTQIRFYPMAGLESRSNGGIFAVSNDFQSWTTVYTIPATPAAGWNTVNVTTSQTWRYILFQSSTSQYAAMAEIEYYNGATKLSGGVIASPFSDNYPPTAVFDGAVNTAWKSAEKVGWVVMDLNAPLNVVPQLEPLEATAAPGDEVTIYVRNAERASIFDIINVPAFVEIGYTTSDWFNVNINGAGTGTLSVILADGTILTLGVRGISASDVADWRSIVKRPKAILGYTAPPPIPDPVPVTQVIAPVISPAEGTYSTTQSVTMVCATSGATIRYTLDGSEPTSSSTVYSTPLSVAVTTTVKAKAFKSGMTDSLTAKTVISIGAAPLVQVSAPVISPAGSTYSTTQSVTMVCATSGATIRYTLDGSEPTSSSTVYSTPLSVAVTTTVKAKAFKSGMTDSATAMAVYTIAVTPTPITQTIGTGSDTFVLRIAQDYYLAGAQYIIKVDGVQVGGTLTASALKSSGQSDTINVQGNWGTGSHTVTVEFLNDAYGGTPQTDRNLYVTGITYNGAPMTPASANLPSAGTATFRYGAANTTLPIALWVYSEFEDDVLAASSNVLADLGFNEVILDILSSTRTLTQVLNKAQAKGVGVWFLCTRGGPDIESLSTGDFSAYGNFVDEVKTHPALRGYYVSDEADKTGSGGSTGDALRKSNYATLVSTINSHDSIHPTVNVSTAFWYSGSSSSTERAFSRDMLTKGDDVVLFGAFPQNVSLTTITAMCNELKTLFSGSFGLFLPVWIAAGNTAGMASTQQMVDAAMVGKATGAKYLAGWGWKDYNSPMRWDTIGTNATIYARVKAAIAQIRSQW